MKDWALLILYFCKIIPSPSKCRPEMNEMQPVDNSADGVTALSILNKHFCKSFMYLTVYIARLSVSPEVT